MEEHKKIHVYKQGNLIFKEEYIKEGLEVVESRSNLYTLIGTLILCFVSIAAYAQITDISNLMYQPEYLCKSSNISSTYNVTCMKEFVCNNTKIEGVDYILNNLTYKESLITDYGIYCSNVKISSFGSAYFFGGFLGIFLGPELKKSLGHIGLIFYASLICVISNFVLLFISNYWLGITVYALGMIGRNMLQLPCYTYYVEMGNTKNRSIIFCIMTCTMPLSGLFVNLIEVITGNYRGQILSNSFLFLIALIFSKTLLVESCSHNFGVGKYTDIIEDLGYIAMINGSSKEYRNWIKKVDKESKEFLETDVYILNEMTGSSLNQNQMVTYYSIWTFKNISSVMIYFIIFNTTSQFNFIFLLYEVVKVPHFYLATTICYIMDILGIFFGSWIIDTDYFKRRFSTVLLNLLAGLSFIATGIVVNLTNTYDLIYINRFFNGALQMIVYLYLIEILPRIIFPHANSICRISSRFLNIFTPVLMVYFPVICYFIIASLNIILSLLIYIFDIKETKGVPIQELPEEFKDPEFMKKLKEKTI